MEISGSSQNYLKFLTHAQTVDYKALFPLPLESLGTRLGRIMQPWLHIMVSDIVVSM